MKKLIFVITPILIVCGTLFSAKAFSFGQDGHRILTKIAENHLTEKTAQTIENITGGGDLSKLSLWPDSIRKLPDWKKSAPWHYISIDDHESFADFKRSDKGDILSALQYFYQQLQNPNLGNKQQIEALAFLLHFVGDLHQPLHVGRRDDRGGNEIDIKWLSKSKIVNLHWVWDGMIIDTEHKTAREYAARLDQASDQQIDQWQGSSFLDWARESKNLRVQVYDFSPEIAGNHRVIGTDYVARNKPIIEQRLLMAGIRLAGCLNAIFDPQKPYSKPDKK